MSGAKRGETSEKQRNLKMIFDLQKANIWKRTAAALLDAILACILAAGFAFLVSVICGYDSFNDRLDEYYASYEKEYGVTFDISREEYDALSEEESKKYNAAYDALVGDEQAMHTYNMVISLSLLITTTGIFLSLFALEFIIPLIFKNGQTVGKKIFGIGVMRTGGFKMNTVSLLIRTLLGKYTIETMIPVLIVIMIYFSIVGLIGTVILGLILILQIILLASTRTNSVIHDLLADTVVVDMSSQKIFDTEGDVVEYRKKLAAEEAANEKYR